MRAQSSDTGRLYADKAADVVQNVEFSIEHGFYDTAFQLTLSTPTPAAEIRYTLDGSDPRLRGSDLNPNAAIFEDATTSMTLISRGSTWSYMDDGSDQDAAWRYLNFSDSLWGRVPAQLGYGENDEATVVGYGPSSSNKYATFDLEGMYLTDDFQYLAKWQIGAGVSIEPGQ